MRGSVLQHTAAPMDIRLRYCHGFAMFVQLASDQHDAILASHADKLDNRYRLREAFRKINLVLDRKIGHVYRDAVAVQADTYDGDIASAFNAIRVAIAGSACYNRLDPDFVARCMLMHLLLETAQVFFRILYAADCVEITDITDALQESTQGTASEVDHTAKHADVTVAALILKRIFDAEMDGKLKYKI